MLRDAISRANGKRINDILCHGKTLLPADLSPVQHEHLEAFARRGLISTSSGMLTLKPQAAPYTRTIAAIFDPRLNNQIGRFSAPV